MMFLIIRIYRTTPLCDGWRLWWLLWPKIHAFQKGPIKKRHTILRVFFHYQTCKFVINPVKTGTVAIVSLFAFLFLVPFVLDPAISTMMHQFVEAPVHCRVTRYDLNYGLTNCTWSSCREAPEIFTHSPSFRCDTISSNSGSVIQSGQDCVSDL